MRSLKVITGALVIIGAVNWGFVALAEFDLVATLFGMEFGETNALTRVVYGLVGLSAIHQVLATASSRELTPVHSARTAA